MLELLLPFVWLAIALNLGVMSVYYALRRSFKTLRYLIALVTVSLIYYPVLELVLILKDPTRPVSIILTMAFAGMTIVSLLTYFAYRLLMTFRGKQYEPSQKTR
jgi:antibiotic biosynthesis monooxygenase (ABM) superfamily enzyme